MNHTPLDSVWLHVGTRRQFFFDDLMLEQVQDVTRRYHHPTRKAAKPMIKADQPWEHVTYFTYNAWNVIYDIEVDLFKCFYEDWTIDAPQKSPTWISDTDGKFCVDFHGRFPSRLCYAQSKDGLQWEKPPLGRVYENGRNTNIVIGGEQVGTAHSTYVLHDTTDPDKQKRFKAIFEHRRLSGGNDMAGEGHYRVAYSPDGIDWDITDRPIRFGHCGDVLGDVATLIRHPETQFYWANTRHFRMCSSTIQDRRKPVQPSWICPTPLHRRAQQNLRRIFRMESVDLFNWTTPQPMLAPDNEWDNIDDAFYGMEQFQIGEDWLGFLNVFHMADNTMDVQLVYSRDGQQFSRVQPGRPWHSTGQEGQWDQHMVNITSKPFVVGEEHYVYYGGARNHHDWWIVGANEGLDVPEAHDMNLVDYGLGLATIKRDRFVSIGAAEAREGVVVTPAVFSNGRRLVVNVLVHNGGSLRVAVADGHDNVFDGFTREDCHPLTGDFIAETVRWKQGAILPIGDVKKLHFYLKHADLFSFEFVED